MKSPYLLGFKHSFSNRLAALGRVESQSNMKPRIQHLIIAVGALCLCGCANTAIKQSWKAPTYQHWHLVKPAMGPAPGWARQRLGVRNDSFALMGAVEDGEAAVEPVPFPKAALSRRTPRRCRARPGAGAIAGLTKCQCTYQGGPVQKIAVVAVAERGLVRQGIENRFERDLRANRQEATAMHELISLPEIKADKNAAAARLSGAGATAVLLVRLIDQTTYGREVQATPERWVPTVTGYAGYGWYDCYSVAYMNLGVTWGSSKQKVYLDTSLFDLKSGQRLWSALTLTTLKEETDRLAEVDSLVAKVVAVLRQDGLAR